MSMSDETDSYQVHRITNCTRDVRELPNCNLDRLTELVFRIRSGREDH